MPLTFEAVPRGCEGQRGLGDGPGEFRGWRGQQECSLSVCSYSLRKGMTWRMF